MEYDELYDEAHRDDWTEQLSYERALDDLFVRGYFDEHVDA